MNKIDLRGTPPEIQSGAKELIDELNAVSKAAHFAERALDRLKEEQLQAFINDRIGAKTLIEILRIKCKNKVCQAAFGEFDGEGMFIFDQKPTKKEAQR